MSEPTREAYQREVDKNAGLAQPGVEYATVGWANNPVVMDLGTGGDNLSESGSTLFRVTLVRGRMPGGDPKPGLAEGHEILADFLGPMFVPYAAGQRVAVCWPKRGAPALILGTVGASPAQQFKAGRAVLDLGALCSLVIKARDVVIMDHASDAPGAFGAWLGVGPIAGGPAGVYANDGAGGGWQSSGGVVGAQASDGGSPPNATAVLQLTATEAKLVSKGNGWIGVDAQGATVFSSGPVNLVGAKIGLGSNPTLPVLGGPSGIAGMPSVSVLVSVS